MYDIVVLCTTKVAIETKVVNIYERSIFKA